MSTLNTSRIGSGFRNSASGLVAVFATLFGLLLVTFVIGRAMPVDPSSPSSAIGPHRMWSRGCVLNSGSISR